MGYEELVSIENVFSAWEGFRRGKQMKRDVLVFERHLEDNIFALQRELHERTYTHSRYSTFVIHDPKRRTISKAEVRDRIVHHLLFSFLEPLFQPSFIHHSYSCQKNKGTHAAVAGVHRALRKVSRNYTRLVWSLKLDIRKFFDSVDHAILMDLLRKTVRDRDVLELLEKNIRSFHSPAGPDTGVPIGNLTSQIFGNIYLSELDAYVKDQLREQYYFRYADDILLLHPDRAHLTELERQITLFVRERLRLTVHPKKIFYRKLRQGIDFVGLVLLPGYRALRTRTKKRMFRKVRNNVLAYNAGVLDARGLDQSMQSYLGILGYCAARRTREQLLNEVWLKKEHRY